MAVAAGVALKAGTLIRWGLGLVSSFGLFVICALVAPIGFVVMLSTMSQTNESVCGIHNAAGEGALVVSPLEGGSYSVGDGYGMRRHPFTGHLKMHWGQDYPTAAGSPIYAVAAGTVTTVRSQPSGENWVEIAHTLPDGEKFSSLYMHSEQSGFHVRPGQFVLAGQLIADVGSSGMATGPHLHLEVRVDKAGERWAETGRQDPVPWLEGHGAISVDRC